MHTGTLLGFGIGVGTREPLGAGRYPGGGGGHVGAWWRNPPTCKLEIGALTSFLGEFTNGGCRVRVCRVAGHPRPLPFLFRLRWPSCPDTPGSVVSPCGPSSHVLLVPSGPVSSALTGATALASLALSRAVPTVTAPRTPTCLTPHASCCSSLLPSRPPCLSSPCDTASGMA